MAIELVSPELVQLRQTLAASWSDWLSAQDRQGYRPHITIQNKVAAPEARRVYGQLLEQWQPLQGDGEGLLLWYYQGGPWTLANEFSFAAKATVDP
ncbi:MAG TPA: 2'-5' RNA ligase family protein, partial [Candidatus Sericytochromatia bacterium]